MHGGDLTDINLLVLSLGVLLHLGDFIYFNFLFLAVLGMESRALHLLGRCSTIKLTPSLHSGDFYFPFAHWFYKIPQSMFYCGDKKQNE